MVTVYACRPCACSRQREVTPSVVPSSFEASVCDEQLKSIGGEIALSGNRLSGKKIIAGLAVAVHRQGRQHPCRGAEAGSHGPSRSEDDGDSQLQYIEKVVHVPVSA